MCRFVMVLSGTSTQNEVLGWRQFQEAVLMSVWTFSASFAVWLH